MAKAGAETGLERMHIQLALAHVHHPTLTFGCTAGFLTKFDDDRIFPNITTALAWATEQNRHEGDSPRISSPLQ